MNTLRAKRILGFTIIELMIVLVIVAILLALAYPSYIDYVRKSKRGEAQQLLLNWSINQEIWRSNNTSYTTDGGLIPTHDLYNFSVAADAVSYTLTATAQNDQANDKARNGTSCAVLNLNSNGTKYSNGDTTQFVCWD